MARSVLDLDQTRKFSRLALTKPDESENLITENAGRVLRNSADAQKTSVSTQYIGARWKSLLTGKPETLRVGNPTALAGSE